jgi:hypothetical protein
VNRVDVWSFGGGVQSAALAVLVVRGLVPRPDLVVIADTGREASATWAYLDAVIRPYLDLVGLEVCVASHELAKVDLYSHHGHLLLPAWSGAGGKLRTFCSAEWKRDVVSRWLRRRGVLQCRSWLGISADEAERVSRPRKKWLDLWFPLVDLGITRPACLSIVAAAGLPRPPRSSCWCCPHRGDAEWRELRDNWPADWRRAVELDEAVHDADVAGGGDGLRLHVSRMPLSTVDLDGGVGGVGSVGCETGECWT